jgi:RNA polymerase primary sigma factor
MNKNILINTEDIQSYIKDIKKIKVITHERQDVIFTELKKVNLSKEKRDELLGELVIGNLRFVISVAKNYQNSGMELIDLISEGNIGLIKAAERFDPNSGNKFTTYAVWWIKQSIMSSLNEYSRVIRIPSNIIQENQKRKKSDNNLENNFYVSFTDNDNELILPHCINLHEEINEDGDQLIDFIINPNAESPEDILNTKDEIRKKISIILSVFSISFFAPLNLYILKFSIKHGK